MSFIQRLGFGPDDPIFLVFVTTEREMRDQPDDAASRLTGLCDKLPGEWRFMWQSKRAIEAFAGMLSWPLCTLPPVVPPPEDAP